MGKGTIIVIDNAVQSVTRLFDRAHTEVGLDVDMVYAANFPEGITAIEERNGNLSGVVTELLDAQSSSVLTEIIFATRGKGDSRYIPIVAHTNSYSDKQERFARVLEIDGIVEKGANSARTVCELMKGLLTEPEKYRGRPLMVPLSKPRREGEPYFPFENDYANLLRLRKGVLRG